MNIGELAELSQVNAKTIRRYEEQGIIPKPARNDSGYRQYGGQDVAVLKLVRQAKLLGFSAKDTKQLVSLWKNQTRASSQVKKIALKHIQEIEGQIQNMESMLKTLKELTRHCHGDERANCSILNELGK